MAGDYGAVFVRCFHCGWHACFTEQGTREKGKGQKVRATQPFPKPGSRAPEAAQVWRTSRDPRGTVVERYWQARGLHIPVPPTIRFHPDRYGYPAMIAACGLPRLDGDNWHPPHEIHGVQQTLLRRDGSWHVGADGRKAKFSLGEIRGQPVCVAVNPESLALTLAEGVEKAASAAWAMGVDAWAILGKVNLVAAAEKVPAVFETVMVVEDADAVAECETCAARLEERGFEALIVSVKEDADGR
jgi:hypothetical protein